MKIGAVRLDEPERNDLVKIVDFGEYTRWRNSIKTGGESDSIFREVACSRPAQSP